MIELKRLAAERKQTLSSVVDEFMREGIQRARSAKRKRHSIAIPTFHMGTAMVNVADRDQLYEVLDGR
jgi:hypothetical protein